MIIIDTTIWSKAYRRKRITGEDRTVVDELCNILEAGEEILIGSVRQELLSGISNKDVFNDLKLKLSGFNNYEAQMADHDLAAEYFTICSQNGIQGSQIDYLICAIAYRYNFQIYTEDKDFNYYKKYLPINLYKRGLNPTPGRYRTVGVLPRQGENKPRSKKEVLDKFPAKGRISLMNKQCFSAQADSAHRTAPHIF